MTFPSALRKAYLALLLLLLGCGSPAFGSSANQPPEPVTSVPSAAGTPLASEHLAFCAYSAPNGHWALYMSQADGRHSVQFQNDIWPGHDIGCWKFESGEYQVAGIVWSKKGDSLFVSVGDFVETSILQITASGDSKLGPAQLVWPAERGFRSPQEISLSPDGEKLAFIGTAFPLTAQPIFEYYHLFVGNLAGTHFYPLTDIHQRIEPIFDPSWSPDGQWVAVAKTHPHNGVGIARSDGSGVTWLTEETVPEFPVPTDSLRSPLSAVTPIWYRDSSQLFFLVALHGEVASALYRVRPTGAGLTKLRESNVYAPALTPDGTHLAFATYDDEEARSGGSIVLTDLDAQHPGELVRMEAPAGQKLLIRDLAWSADGQHLAFAANPRGNMDLYVVNADGTNLQDITGWPGDEIAPRWRP